MKRTVFISIAFCLLLVGCKQQPAENLLSALTSPVLFPGDELTAYRDPAVLYHNGEFHLFFTLVETEPDGYIYSYVAYTKSSDLKKWDEIIRLTEKDQQLNYSSPGNVIRYDNEWILCFQTYPRPDYTVHDEIRYGDRNCRLYSMRSADLKEWSSPELMKVKGQNVSFEEMGRMIDPYLIADKDNPGLYWCFYKQNGVSMSYTRDFETWEFFGYTGSGENVCVLIEEDEYILLHSPENGMAIKRSSDLKNWTDQEGLITLGQDQWEWACGRITAGAIVNLKDIPEIGKYVMFFHGSGPLTEPEGDFDRNSSIGIAWSSDLTEWEWAQKNNINL